MLSDYRQAELDLSTLDIYLTPRLLAEALAPHGVRASSIKRAIVVSGNLKDFHFFETVTLNTGQDLRMFQDMDAARKWLLEEEQD